MTSNSPISRRGIHVEISIEGAAPLQTCSRRAIDRRGHRSRIAADLLAPRPQPEPRPRIRMSWGALTYDEREAWGGVLSGLAADGLLVCWAGDVLERVFLAGVDNEHIDPFDLWGFELLISEALEVLAVNPPRK